MEKQEIGGAELGVWCGAYTNTTNCLELVVLNLVCGVVHTNNKHFRNTEQNYLYL